jgi:hypothetical protein
LFTLRDTKAIPFGTAVSYAEKAEKATGVHPALTLAILRQETNLGANVGTCNRSTDPTSKSWENIMKSPRDTEPYKRIMADLGLPLANNATSPVVLREMEGEQEKKGYLYIMMPVRK